MLSPDGKLCAVQVMNGSNKPKDSPFYNANGKLLLYRVEGTRLLPVGAAWIGRWAQGIAFSADSRTILVQNMVERDIQVLRWDGSTLTDTGQRIKTNGGPAAIRIARLLQDSSYYQLRDIVDRIVAQWADVRPDLDASPILIVTLLKAAAFTAKEAAVGFALGATGGFVLGDQVRLSIDLETVRQTQAEVA